MELVLWCNGLSCNLRHRHAIQECWFETCLLSFPSSFRLIMFLGRLRKRLVPCYSVRRLEEFWAPGFHPCTPGWCGHLENRPVEGRSLFFCLYPSLPCNWLSLLKRKKMEDWQKGLLCLAIYCMYLKLISESKS